MITNKKFTDPAYDGWILPETCEDVDGTLLPRHYDESVSPRKLLSENPWKVPRVLSTEDGNPLTKENWKSHRQYLLNTVMEYGFGFTPKAPEKIESKILWDSSDESELYAGVLKTYGGKAVCQRIELSFEAPYGKFSFPIQVVRPFYGEKRTPAIIHIAFNPSLRDLPLNADISTQYAPIEEIIDNGFTYVQFCYNDVIEDLVRGEFKKAFKENGMGKVFFAGDKREPTEIGKVGMWAYAASRVVDYLLTRDDIDHNCISVAGHSRLGKTALWTAAQDERIFAGLVNCSGFGGAGLIGVAERRFIDMINNGGIEWWCEKAKEYAYNPKELPYDAHFIIAAIAPRFISLVAADGDFAKYQLADYLSAYAATPVFEALGLKGLVAPETLPRPSVIYNDGHIGYALRPGSHFFSRWDWNVHMEFIKKKRAASCQ